MHGTFQILQNESCQSKRDVCFQRIEHFLQQKYVPSCQGPALDISVFDDFDAQIDVTRTSHFSHIHECFNLSTVHFT